MALWRRSIRDASISASISSAVMGGIPTAEVIPSGIAGPPNRRATMTTETTETPQFRPPWWLRGPHAQTIGAALTARRRPERGAVVRRVDLGDGDALAVHDDTPAGWQPGGRVAILSHGLADDHRSPLLGRLTDKLTSRGVRVFRWDMRCCGAGLALARHPYHAGCSADLAAVVGQVVAWCREDQASPAADPDLSLFGVSLSGNVLLKYLGEHPGRVPAAVRQAIAVNPPIDLVMGCEAIASPRNRFYDRYFTRLLVRHLHRWWRVRADAMRPTQACRPQTLRQFDDWFTAPALGYRDALDYYRHESAAGFIPEIRVPTRIITTRDDPFVPFEMFAAERVAYPDTVRLVATEQGGHVGFIGRAPGDPDSRWLDWRVVALIAPPLRGTPNRVPPKCLYPDAAAAREPIAGIDRPDSE
jgi:predicted alpha/beta-fold hydrolase